MCDAPEDASELAEVIELMSRLLVREDVTSQFVNDMVQKTDTATDVLRRSELWEEYRDFCRGKQTALKDRKFNVDIERVLEAPTKKSGSLSNFLRGYKLTPP